MVESPPPPHPPPSRSDREKISPPHYPQPQSIQKRSPPPWPNILIPRYWRALPRSPFLYKLIEPKPLDNSMLRHYLPRMWRLPWSLFWQFLYFVCSFLDPDLHVYGLRGGLSWWPHRSHGTRGHVHGVPDWPWWPWWRLTFSSINRAFSIMGHFFEFFWWFFFYYNDLISITVFFIVGRILKFTFVYIFGWYILPLSF